ncbi:MAG: transcriptional regulator [Sporomusaceae bacterium]|nr:transcriptional regulator [Sporomusaceae bacterium]
MIEQTNRTILFEEFNPEKLDLLTIIGDTKGVESLSDEQIKEINEKLLVKSFDEFLDKFTPVIYSFYNAANQRVIYTLKKPESIPPHCITEIPIGRHNDFLKMLMTLIDAKSAVGTPNVDFKFENLLDMISPRKIMDDIRQSRKEINYVYSKYDALDDGEPQKLDIGDKLNILFEEASQNYNNIMAMLPLAIEDIKTRLLLTGGSQSGGNEPLKLGVLSMGDNGELKIIEAPKVETTALAVIDDKANTGLISAFEEDYEAVNENPSLYIKHLVVRTFCPLPSTMQSEIDVATEVQNYNTYLEFYKNAKDEFIKTVKPLVEKIIGVKMFFDQYNTKTKGMMPSLLVVNAKLEMVVKSTNIIRLDTYLNTVNAKNDFTNTVWFGIVPSLGMDMGGKVKLTRERFKGNEVKINTDVNTTESLALLLNTVQKYKVQIFFSFEGREESTFNYVATSGIDKFIDKCAPLTRQDYSEYAIACIPNFTIIPKDKSGVVLDNKMTLNEDGGVELSKLKEDIMKFWIEGVYIGSAYVAAGLVAAYQCPEFLREIFKNANRNYPGVRFDIESGNNALQFTTTLAKEISGFTSNIKNVINRRSFGFVFSSESAKVKGKDVKKIAVYKARSLGSSGDDFDCIYKTTVVTYIERILRFSSSDFKQDNIISFFSKNPNSQKSLWLAQKGYINSIVQEGDDINFSINEALGLCNIDVIFNGNSKNLEVEITKNAAGGV